MREVKLPYLPSDTEKRKGGDLIADFWVKRKEIEQQQHKSNIRIRMKNIVIFGAPGSGKGTQSDLMIEHYGLGHISTGDVLRSEIKKDTELGRLAASYIDGFPRTIPQAEALKTMLQERGDKVAAMIELDVPEEELMDRLIKRGKESGRADDNEETIKKRLVIYHQQTQPLIEWYKQEGLHHHINGHGTLERIFSDIKNVIDNL